MQDQALKELSNFRGFGFSWQKFKKIKSTKTKTHTQKQISMDFTVGEKKKKTQPRKKMGREERKNMVLSKGSVQFS